ncbi:tripartite tricarboxylate transporter TctB family protein [Desulfospira joergensenii]|uniref:tripartite tricarboxylate transporter TctB family protein n=1 Tax=Desulfospira joergensenii TaxID=53329 RepID=UPI0003B59629|nr:tripartite tricarboxylate transporter TctB family protein [Desulfospira joergensenii]
MKSAHACDKIIGLGIVLFSMILLIFIIPRECDSSGGGGGIGPDFFPNLITGIMCVLGFWLFFRKNEAPEENKQKRHTAAVVVTAIMLLVYTYLAEYLGYISSTAVILLFFLIYYGCRNKIMIPLIVIFVTGALYLFFGRVMQVMLPCGILI